MISVVSSALCGKDSDPLKPMKAVPSERQINWHQMQFYGFIHFTINTFTGKEWGYGDESPELFNPSELNAEQWAKAASDAGMKGLILTAKHHDGFCLWPTKYTEHSIKNSPYKKGKGDIVRELKDACDKYNLKFGVYLSPWDRNHKDYGKPQYVEYYRNQLRELMTNYGDMFEIWHDGANGGDGYYGGDNSTRKIDKKTYYGWDKTWAMIRELQPGAVVFSDAGPDARWVGNEQGFAPSTCWASINPEGMYPGIADTKVLGNGTPGGEVWRPAEVDVSIRDGWFFHEDQSPKSIEKLLQIYFDSVGNGANLLLNITPDKRGLIPDEDVKRLKDFGSIIKGIYKEDLAKGKSISVTSVRDDSGNFDGMNINDGDRQTYWSAKDKQKESQVILDMEDNTDFNVIRIEEYYPLGQRISSFSIDIHTEDGWQRLHTGTTIGVRKVIRFDKVKADKIRLNIEDALAVPTISTFEVYNAKI